MYKYPGMYKNFDDLEEYLTREELMKLIEKARDIDYQKMKFMAALQGADLDSGTKDDSFEAVAHRANLRVNGEAGQEALDLSGLISVVDEDGE